jgi:nucleotide-binding universal stress UspA family protein
VKLLIVAHHRKKIWEQWLAGSVSKYLIDEATMPVVVVHG